MPVSPEKPEKRMRVGTTKVKTGCITCKIRRVKCDEQKPACQRCASTGRKCDGYTGSVDVALRKPAARNSDPSHDDQETPNKSFGEKNKMLRNHRSAAPCSYQTLVLGRNPLRIPKDPLESRSMDYFICRTAPQLSGLFDSKFWCDMVLRVGQHDPAVRLGAIAVSSMYEYFEIRTTTPQHSVSAEPSYAIRQYNKAIGSLSGQLAQGSASLEVVLTCCVLFVCLEFMRGETKPAFAHIQSGHKILADWRKKNDNGNLDGSLSLRTWNATGFEETMLPLLAQLDVLGVLFGHDPSGIDWGKKAEHDVLGHQRPESFTKMDDARLSILNTLNLSLRLEAAIITSGGDVTIDGITEHIKLETRLEEWLAAFTEFMESKTDWSPADIHGSMLVQIHYHISRVLVHTNLAHDEMAYDRLMPDFEAIVSFAESLVSLEPTKGKQTTAERPSISFTFEMGMISPLYYTALKCRRLSLRRKAVALLRAGPRRESMWDADVAAQVCERVISLEENGLVPGLHLADMTTEASIDANQRIDRVIIMAAPNFNSGTAIVCHFSKLDRSLGRWRSWQETLPNRSDVSYSSTDAWFGWMEGSDGMSLLGYDETCAAVDVNVDVDVDSAAGPSWPTYVLPERDRISGLAEVGLKIFNTV